MQGCGQLQLSIHLHFHLLLSLAHQTCKGRSQAYLWKSLSVEYSVIIHKATFLRMLHLEPVFV